MRTWNSYSVVAVRPVIATLDSLCAPSVPESATVFHVAVHASAGLVGFVRWRYCHWYAVKAELSAAGVVQESVSPVAVTLLAVGAATVGAAVVVPAAEASAELPMLLPCVERTCT